MKITVISDGLMVTPSSNTGGLQRVAYDLVKTFEQMGHIVTLVAAKGSHLPPNSSGKLVETVEANLNNLMASEIANAESALKTGYDLLLDITHTHQAAYKDTERSVIYHQDVSPVAAHPRIVCISEAQASRVIPKNTAYTVIHNHVGEPFLPDYVRKGELRQVDTALFVGNIVPHKGAHLAIEVARRLDVPIWVAGPLLDGLYAQRVLDDCDGVRAVYIGALDNNEKARVMAQARMMILCPNRSFNDYHETAQLVAMEAALMGTPTLGSANGGFPEYVTEEIGLCGKTISEMVEKGSKVWEYKKERSRDILRYAWQHFTYNNGACRKEWENVIGN